MDLHLHGVEIVAKNVKEVVILGWKEMKWFVSALLSPTKGIAVMIEFLTIFICLN